MDRHGIIFCHDILCPIYISQKKEWLESIINDTYNFKVGQTSFFYTINNAIETKNWVDIENEYYLLLKKIVKKETCGYSEVKQLDAELKLVADKLKTYLNYLQTHYIKDGMLIKNIQNIIYGPIHIDDISNQGKERFNQFLEERFKYLIDNTEWKNRLFSNRFELSYITINGEIRDYRSYLKPKEEAREHLDLVAKKSRLVPDCFLLPDQILLLNFNYTKTADLYIPKGSDFRINHIHGELDNDDNPIIFGYGDELDEDYKAIKNLNNNDYLTNMKTIRYLETDNLRRLLTFINSAPYQIYIMGHSCGNSDRTLLNTLFEHRNCVSIKPFYHQKEDGTDNYIDLVQNISRNFNDMQMMRDRVVNKSYCRPLVSPRN